MIRTSDLPIRSETIYLRNPQADRAFPYSLPVVARHLANEGRPEGLGSLMVLQVGPRSVPLRRDLGLRQHPKITPSSAPPFTFRVSPLLGVVGSGATMLSRPNRRVTGLLMAYKPPDMAQPDGGGSTARISCRSHGRASPRDLGTRHA
jgi:hypothetical protein